MLIKTIALVNLIGLFFFGALFPAEIRVSQETPAMMAAGSEVKVTVAVDKGELSGFAKLQIDLPAGMSATAIETKGASFTFADGKAKFIWMALPASPKFNISYTLKADATMSGSVNLNGKLSYIEDNERKTYDIPTSTVQISGGAVAQQPEHVFSTTSLGALNFSGSRCETFNVNVLSSSHNPVFSKVCIPCIFFCM